jgi:hypothetical protein
MVESQKGILHMQLLNELGDAYQTAVYSSCLDGFAGTTWLSSATPDSFDAFDGYLFLSNPAMILCNSPNDRRIKPLNPFPQNFTISGLQMRLFSLFAPNVAMISSSDLTSNHSLACNSIDPVFLRSPTHASNPGRWG